MEHKDFSDHRRISSKEEFEKIFRSLYEELCSYAHYFLRDVAASEEVVQDLFVNLWNRRESVDLQPSIKSYLYRSVRNRCYNVIKHQEVKDRYRTEQMSSLSAREGIPNDGGELNELQERINKAIAELPPERQKIFVMSRFEDLKYKEIAEELKISIKTVENQMGKALKHLRLQLADYMPLLILLGLDLLCFEVDRGQWMLNCYM